MLYPSTANTTGGISPDFFTYNTSTQFTNLSSLGESMKVVQTVDVTMDNTNQKYISVLPENGKMTGKVLVNGQGAEYSLPQAKQTEL